MKKYRELIEKVKEEKRSNLKISDYRVKDISPLFSLSHLTELSLNGCLRIQDIKPLKYLMNLRKLDLFRLKRLEDISSLSFLINLTELNLCCCENIKDIRPLSALGNLTYLDLSCCYELKDISPISFLSNLTHLDLGFCKNVQDFSPLNALTQLTHLEFSGYNQLKDLSLLSSLSNLNNLNLYDCHNLKDISEIVSLQNLKSINLSRCNKIKDFSPLCYLSSLEEWTLPVRSNIENILPKSSIAEIHQDEQGRLHNEKGPSISYKEGLNLYHWHGVAIPKSWIVENLPSPQEALELWDVERRRVACEMIGWVNIIKELDAKVIDENPDPEIGTLLEVLLPGSRKKDRFLKVRCGTGREFVIPVPPNKRTAHGANAWTWGLDTSKYRPEVRT